MQLQDRPAGPPDCEGQGFKTNGDRVEAPDDGYIPIQCVILHFPKPQQLNAGHVEVPEYTTTGGARSE